MSDTDLDALLADARRCAETRLRNEGWPCAVMEDLIDAITALRRQLNAYERKDLGSKATEGGE